MTAKHQTTFAVTLRAEGCESADEAYRALRAFLKMAGRAYRLRCVSAIEVDAKTACEDSPESTIGGQRDE